MLEGQEGKGGRDHEPQSWYAAWPLDTAYNRQKISYPKLYPSAGNNFENHVLLESLICK